MLKKGLAGFSILIMSLSFSAVVFASSYITSYSFLVSVQGATRTFDGQNIAFESFATSYPAPHIVVKTYTAELYRDKGWWGKDYIGKVTLPRDQWGKAKWSNVGPGNYYVYLNKANDGITLKDSNVKIYNY